MKRCAGAFTATEPKTSPAGGQTFHLQKHEANGSLVQAFSCEAKGKYARSSENDGNDRRDANEAVGEYHDPRGKTIVNAYDGFPFHRSRTIRCLERPK